VRNRNRNNRNRSIRQRIAEYKEKMNKEFNQQKTFKQNVLHELKSRKHKTHKSKTGTTNSTGTRNSNNYESNNEELELSHSAPSFFGPIPIGKSRRLTNTSEQLRLQVSSNIADRDYLDSCIIKHFGSKVDVLGEPSYLRVNKDGKYSRISSSGFYYNWDRENKDKVFHITLHKKYLHPTKKQLHSGAFHVKFDIDGTHRKLLLNYIPASPIGKYIISICNEQNEIIDMIANNVIDVLMDYYKFKGFLLEKVPAPHNC